MQLNHERPSQPSKKMASITRALNIKWKYCSRVKEVVFQVAQKEADE